MDAPLSKCVWLSEMLLPLPECCWKSRNNSVTTWCCRCPLERDLLKFQMKPKFDLIVKWDLFHEHICILEASIQSLYLIPCTLYKLLPLFSKIIFKIRILQINIKKLGLYFSTNPTLKTHFWSPILIYWKRVFKKRVFSKTHLGHDFQQIPLWKPT